MRYNLDVILSNKNATKAVNTKFVFPNYLFSGSIILYLGLLLLENIKPGIVSQEFSINWLLIAILSFGLLAAIFPGDDENETIKVDKFIVKKIKYKFSKKLWWLSVLIVPMVVFGYYKIPTTNKNINSIRLSPDKYQVILVNRSNKTRIFGHL